MAGERCGTDRGYQIHYRAGEPACADCQRAHATYRMERYRATHVPVVRAAAVTLGDMPLPGMPRPEDQAPHLIPGLCATCRKCKRRHLSGLPCWAGRYTVKLRELTFATYGDVCWLCGNPGSNTVDHVKSRAMGGDDSLANLRPAHGFCNTGRGAGSLNPATGSRPGTTTETSPRW